MKRSEFQITAYSLAFLALAATAAPAAHALESEQYTLPPVPLADLGPALNQITLDAIQTTLSNLKQRGAPVTEDELIQSVFQELGQGLPETTTEKALKRVRIEGAETLFNPGVKNSIYRGVYLPTPFGFYMDAPTANLFGTYIGLDKVGHFFQQGYDYYKIYKKSLSKGLDEKSALEKAVKFGVKTEHTYYGTLVSGVYSNADLASNMSGFHFYMNLTREIKIGGQTFAPILIQTSEADGPTHWALNPTREFTLAPLYSEHQNEALNPSIYKFNRGRIRKSIRARCEAWLARDPGLSLDSITTKQTELATWHSVEYGRKLPEKKEASLRTECF